MRRGKNVLKIGNYPIDEKGFPLHPFEVNDKFFELDHDNVEKKNNHHRCFYARKFGELAISQALRDLESMQTEMVVWRHDLLHKLYEGISIPPLFNIMEKLEEEKTNGQPLKIFNDITKQYEYSSITDDTWSSLNQQYNGLSDNSGFIDLFSHKLKK